MNDAHARLAATMLDRLLAGLPRRDGWRLSLWANFLNNPVYADVERRFGLLRDDLNVLYCTACCGEITATTICHLTGRPKNSVSRAIDRQRRAGTIRRRTDPRDRRRSILSIQPEGLALFERILPVFVAREDAMLAALDADDRRQLDAILRKLMASMPAWALDF